MKKVWIAFACTLGVVACGGEEKPAQSPTTTTSTTTSEMMTTTPQPAPAPAPAPAPMTTPTPTPETDMTSPRSYSMPDTSGMPGSTDSTGGAGTTDATGLPAPTTPSTEPSTGTSSTEADKTKETTKKKTTTTTTTGGAASDKTINTAVRSALAADPALASASKNVKITTTGGKVTLRGTVKSDDDKSSIEAKAKATPGVTDVDNQIQVKK